jgi:hypothetical protein
MDQQQEQRFGDDLLIGAKSIADWLNVSVRKVFYWGETGELPLFKIGSLWAGRKTTLIEHFKQVEALAANDAAKKREEKREEREARTANNVAKRHKAPAASSTTKKKRKASRASDAACVSSAA